ncbi:hypothetical protein PIB30_004639 [Stylosanthes scabra]|uniref:Uncharacterized protein n=1 Tax=Stylosanthes scabra TaxID=79078 RepID=A0ABU6Q3K0_9FABA|nr:hypothetical protein [Stylosanthes scabra]
MIIGIIICSAKVELGLELNEISKRRFLASVCPIEAAELGKAVVECRRKHNHDDIKVGMCLYDYIADKCNKLYHTEKDRRACIHACIQYLAEEPIIELEKYIRELEKCTRECQRLFGDNPAKIRICVMDYIIPECMKLYPTNKKKRDECIEELYAYVLEYINNHKNGSPPSQKTLH